MSDWRIGTLSELATGIRGVAYTPDQLQEFKTSNTVTLLRSNNIQSGRLVLTDTQIVPSSAVSEAQNMLPGDIAVCMSNGSKALVGKAAPLITDVGERLTVGAFCSIFRPTAGVEPGFLRYVFQSSDYRRQLDFSLAGSAINNLRNTELESFSTLIPPVDQQRMVANVLDTLDTTICQTEAIIAKLKQVKQGLLHDLLTRGIAANGELRPTYEEAPELYQVLSDRYVPLEWGVDTLAQSCSLIRDGTHLPPVRVSSGPLLLSVRNMKDGKFVLTEQDTRVSESFFNQMHRSWSIQKGDVLLAIVGATIGKIAQVGDMPKFTLQRSVAVLRGKDGRLRNDFMFAYLGTPEFQTALWRQVNQTAQPGIYLDQLGSINIPVPPDSEQQLIVERLTAAESKILLEEASLEKLKNQKLGLMDDLLTGRVRVTPLLTQPATTSP